MKIIQWILDNLFTVLIIAGVLAQLIQAIRGKRAQDSEDGPVVEPPPEAQFEDPELAERTRRIREDIQRRIAERQRGGSGEQTRPAPQMETPPASQWAGEDDAPPPLRREVVAEQDAPRPFATPSPAPASAGASRFEAHRQAEILEQQAAMAERLRDLETMKAAAQRRAAFEALSVSQTTVQREKTRGAVLDDLRDPDALRRAFILREVLGPPVGLR